MFAQEAIGVSGQSDVPTVMMYDEQDPWAVTFAFASGENMVEWTFARELISDAIEAGISGTGDVRIAVTSTEVFVTLVPSTGGDGLVLAYPRPVIELFLSTTEAMVALGAEETDVQAAWDRWVSDGSV